MIEDIAGGIIKTIAKFVFNIFFDIAIEFLIKGPGYFIGRKITKQAPDPDGITVVLTGILFWALIGFSAYMLYSNVGGLNKT